MMRVIHDHHNSTLYLHYCVLYTFTASVESYGRLALGHQKGSLEQSQLDQQFMSRETEFPTDDETIERALDHREFVKEVCA